MGKRKSGRTKEQITKDIRLLRPLIAYVQRYHPKTKPPLFIKTKSETDGNYALALMGLNYAGIVAQNPNAPEKLRKHAERVIRRAHDAVCLNPGSRPRIGISLYDLDYGINRKIKEACQQRREGVDRKKYMSELIDYIKKTEQRTYGAPLSPGWEKRIWEIPWARRKEATVVIETLCVLTGRKKSSVSKEKREYDKDMAKDERELAQYRKALKQKKR